MRNLRTGIHAVVAALALAAVAAPAALADSGYKCAESQSYGSTCISITGDGLEVKDVQGYFVPPNNDYLTHRKWALELTSYTCNPIGAEPRDCSPRHRWFTRPRHTNPPHQGSTCEMFAPNGIGWQQCQDYNMAYADAQFGDWRGFYRMAHQFRHGVWLCSGLAVKAHHRWRPNGPARSPGERGCAEVHA